MICGIRNGSHGAGKLALPGGHLEFGEEWAACAAREVEEETNLVIKESDLKLIHVTNDPMFSENKHYVTLFMCATVPSSSVPRNMEEDKCGGWEEFDVEALKKWNGEGKLFGPLKRLVEADDERFLAWLNE